MSKASILATKLHPSLPDLVFLPTKWGPKVLIYHEGACED